MSEMERAWKTPKDVWEAKGKAAFKHVGPIPECLDSMTGALVEQGP